MEVKEEFVKLKREDVGLYLKSFKSTTSVAFAAGKWKNKAVSIVSPKSERILKKRTTEVQQSRNENLLSNILGYFKDVKVSDVKYEDKDEGKHCPYNRDWATRIIKPSKKDEDVKETGRNNSLDNIIVSETPFKCPKVEKCLECGIKDSDTGYCDYNRENKLKLPPSYHGSEMFMPNGDQLFWVRFKDRLVDFDFFSLFI